MFDLSQQNKYAYRRDIPWSLDLEDNGDIKMITDVDAINQSIKTILLTDFGSLPMNPKFGTRLQSLLFENALPEGFLQREIEYRIKTSLSTQEPDITVINVNVDSQNINNQEINVMIEYKLNDGITTGVFNEVLSINNTSDTYRSN